MSINTPVIRARVEAVPAPPLVPDYPAAAGVLVNDTHSQLNATRVDCVVAVDSEDSSGARSPRRAPKAGRYASPAADMPWAASNSRPGRSSSTCGP